MNKARDIKHLALGVMFTAFGLSALAAVNLTTFSPGTPIKSSEVNANFSSLKASLEALEAPGSIDAGKLAAQNGADGKVLKLSGGNLTWGDDLVGTGGATAYSAGGGLALAGTTFSLKDGGVTKDKLSATGEADGKVLKLSGGNLTWGDDLTGAGGATYSADGSSLALSGTTFSVKDAGIGTSKLANAAVTASKLAFPLAVELNSGDPLLSITSTFGNAIHGISSAGGIGLLGRSSLRGVVGTQGSLVLSCAGTYGVGGCAENGIGVLGRSVSGNGIDGGSQSGIGVDGNSQSSIGVDGFSGTFIGTRGQGGGGVGLSITNPVGVLGESSTGFGVYGASTNNIGVRGSAPNGYGVYATSTNGVGIYGESVNNAGVFGRSTNNNSGFFAGGNGGSGTCRYNGGAGWICTSDRNKKENFSPVDARLVLEALAKLPITRWNMKGDSKKTPHIGPVAQDFYAAFGLGEDDKTINSADVQGVALAAIKGLSQENQSLKAQNAELARKIADLATQMASLQAMQTKLAAIESRMGRSKSRACRSTPDPAVPVKPQRGPSRAASSSLPAPTPSTRAHAIGFVLLASQTVPAQTPAP